MNNVNKDTHDFIISLGYKAKEYGYVRKNDNETTQVVTPFSNNQWQIWAEYDSDDSKIYNTGIVTIDSAQLLHALILLFEDVKND